MYAVIIHGTKHDDFVVDGEINFTFVELVRSAICHSEVFGDNSESFVMHTPRESVTDRRITLLIFGCRLSGAEKDQLAVSVYQHICEEYDKASEDVHLPRYLRQDGIKNLCVVVA